MNEGPSELLNLTAPDQLWQAQLFSLLMLPFAHEDLAILLGGYIVVNRIMPAGFVALCIYGGMVASDFALYGIGAGARHLPWLSRLAVDDRVRRCADLFKHSLLGFMVLCRVVPGVVFVAFVACGWMRVPLVRFAAASLLVSALYLPLMLCIVVFFGDALDDRVGLWTWPFLLCVLVAIGFLRRQVFALGEADAAAVEPGDNVPKNCWPKRNSRARAAMLRARLLPILFYFPLGLSWIGFALRYRSLTLPTVANPYPLPVGLWEEERSRLLLDVGPSERAWVADFVVMARSSGQPTLYADVEHARQALSAAGMAFPLIAKPDIGCQSAWRIDDAVALREYLRGFPHGEKLLLQRLVPQASEATVLYARLPGEQSGRILSLTFCADGGCRDACRHITPELEARIDAIARSMREFYYGQFELRFSSCVELMRGESFSIIGVRGIGGDAKYARDPILSLAEIYRRMVDQQRITFLIGDKNRARGFQPMNCVDVLKSMVRPIRRGHPASA